MIRIGQIELNEFPLLLAPMEGVTDLVYRSVCKPYGVDMMYTEFVSSEALIRDIQRSKVKLTVHDLERPIGIQIFGNNIENMRQAAILAEQARPDLIDINFGCSIRKIAAKGCGAGILNDMPKMISMTKAVVDAVQLPVTVKTRLGWDDKSKNIEEIAERLQDVGISAITIHGRTKAQIYKGDADWTLIGRVKENTRMHIPVFGNGDITSAQKALEYKNRYGVDGIMIGRACIGNPWIFSETKALINNGEELAVPTMQERVNACRSHLLKAIEVKGEFPGIVSVRRHHAGYFKGVADFRELRIRLQSENSIDDLLQTLIEIEQKFC